MKQAGRALAMNAVKSMAFAALLTGFFPFFAHTQTQHGAAPEDQELTLPPDRPEARVTDSSVLFPVSVESDRLLRIATGPVRGGYYGVGGVICDLMNRDIGRHRIECLVKPTSGSGENVAHVLTGGAEMGLVQSDWQSFAVTSAGTATDSALNFDRLRSVAGLYPLAMQVVVRGNLGIRDLADLDNRRLGLSAPGSSQRQLADVVLAQAGVSSRQLKITVFEGDGDMVRALCADQIDAFIVVAPAPLQSIEIAMRSCGAQMIGVDEAVSKKLIGDREALAIFTLGSESYASLGGNIQTIGYVVTLVASAGLDDRLVAEVARHLIEDFPRYRTAHPALASVRQGQFFAGGLTAPIHDGIARYLNTLEGESEIGSEQGDVTPEEGTDGESAN